MQHNEIQTYTFQQYHQNVHDSPQCHIQESNAPEINYNVPIQKNIPTDFYIIRKIRNLDLKWPLILSLSFEEDLFYIRYDLLDVWGTGDTFEEALESFEDFFLYDYESYEKTPTEKMDFFARQQLRLYRVLLRKA